MMGRLVDADSFAENLIHCSGLGRKSFELVLKALNTQPTAYDVEKVVKELNEESSMFHSMFGYSVCSIRLGKAKDIVRKGGVE